MEREGQPQGEDESGCTYKYWWATPRGAYCLGIRHHGLELSKKVPLRPRGRSELWFSRKAGVGKACTGQE